MLYFEGPIAFVAYCICGLLHLCLFHLRLLHLWPISFAPISFVANETFGQLQMSCLAKLVLGGTKCDRLKYKVVVQV